MLCEFGRNTLIMVAREERIQEEILKFQQSRRNDETRKYVWYIIEILETARKRDSEEGIPAREQGWVRVKVILDELLKIKIPNQTTLYRLLEDLHQAKLIERREKIVPGTKGRAPTYYRTPIAYNNSWFMTREELDREYHDQQILHFKLVMQMGIAAAMLQNCGYEDGKKAIQEEYDRLINDPSKKQKGRLSNLSYEDMVALGLASEFGTSLKKEHLL